MSLGFSGGDIVIAISIIKHAYEIYSQSPKEYEVFSGEVRRVRDNFIKAQELSGNTQWSSEDRITLSDYASDFEALTKDLSTHVERYKSLAKGHGRTRDRMGWSPQEVEKFRHRIITLNTSFSTFLQLVSISPRESSDRDSYDPSLASSASDQQTYAPTTSQAACDQPRSPKSPLFDSLRSNGTSLNAGFGGGLARPSTNKSVKGGATNSEAQRTRSAGEADQPKPLIRKKKAFSFSLGSSSPSLAEVHSPFGQGNSSKKPCSQRST